MLCKELFNYRDKLYYIHRKLKETTIKPEFINELKDFWGCTTVIRQTYKQTNEIYLLFLIEIEDVTIVEEQLDTLSH